MKEGGNIFFILMIVLTIGIVIFLIHFNSISALGAPLNATTEPMAPLWIRDGDIFGLTYSPNNELIYFGGGTSDGLGMFGVYNRTSNITEDLRETDPGNWMGTSIIYNFVYNPNNKLIYFVGRDGVFGAYNRTSNVSEDLRGVDIGNWIGTHNYYSTIYGITLDNNSNTLYFVGQAGLFGLYNISYNLSENLNGTDTGNWMGSSNAFWGITFDPNRNLIYIGGGAGSFGVYNRTSNITEDLRGVDPGDWVGSLATLFSLVFTPTDNLIYFSGKFGVYNRTSNSSEKLNVTSPVAWSGGMSSLAYDPNSELIYLGGAGSEFRVYNRTSNVTEDLRGTDINDWMSTDTSVSGMVFDSTRNLVYLGGGGVFAVYNRTSNLTDDLVLRNDWLRFRNVFCLGLDSTNNLIYLGGDIGILGVYNPSTNTREDLRGTDAGDWIGTTDINGIASDPNHNVAYLAGDNGRFGIYNRTSNSTENLNDTDTGNWMGSNHFYSLAFDSNSNLVYLGGGWGSSTSFFGVYNRTSNSTENLNMTDAGNWIGSSSINGMAYDSTSEVVYLGGMSGVFGIYNRTSNTTEDLRGTDAGDWIGTTPIINLVFDQNNNFVYLVGGNGIDPSTFGVYNRTSNVTEDLRDLDVGDWIGSVYLRGVTSDSANNLVYFSGDYGVFGIYNRTSNTTEDLRGTDAGDWIGEDSIYELAFNPNNNLVYLVGDDGIFAVYNRTSNSTETATALGDETTGGGRRTVSIFTETQTVDATAGGSVSVEIKNSKIDIRNITIFPRTNISNASITVTQNKTGGMKIAFPVGTIYQAFTISTQAIKNEDLNNVTIDFRVNKTWLIEQNLSYENVVLYRVPSSTEIWEPLDTISIREDSNYYYFSAISPGFSTFVILIREVAEECISSQIRCFNDELQICNENKTWVLVKQCQYGCKNRACLKSFFGLFTIDASLFWYMIVAIITFGILVVMYFLFKRVKKTKSSSSKETFFRFHRNQFLHKSKLK